LLQETRAPKKESASKTLPPHDHTAELKRLNRVKGQIEGIERMIIEKRYCPDIVMQIKAARSALRSLEANVVEGHMRHCVKTAIKSRDPIVVQEKLEEILLLMKGQG
jgi:DNA-binding FrmR family transcriptional regulator